MSGRTAKAARKEEKAKKEDFVKRREAMRKDLIALSQKYKIDLVGGLQYTVQGVIPMIVFADMKDKYEHMTQEAKDAEARKNGLKPKLKV